MRTKCVLVGSLVLASLALADEAYRTDSVVITATGFEQDADSNLRNVIVISNKDLEEKGYTSIEEALTRQAGISFVRSGTGGNPSTNIDIRGQGNKANVGVKVMVDGVPLNVLDKDRLHAAQVTISPLDSVAIEDIERIEIIPGGGAVLYGNGTRGGAINIITKKSKETQASVGFSQKVFNSGHRTTDVNLNFSAKISPNIAFSTNISGFQGTGYRYKDKDDGFYANSKLYIDIDDKQSFSVNFAYFRDDSQDTGALSWYEFKGDPTQAGDGLRSYVITRPELNAEYKISLGKMWDLSAKAFWQKQEIITQDDDSRNYNAAEFKDGVTGANLKARLNYMQNSYLIFGYDFQRNNSQTLSDIPMGRISWKTTSDDTKDAQSFFALVSHEFVDFFALSAGARYEHASYEQIGKSEGISSRSYDLTYNTSTDNYALELTPNFRYSSTGKIYAKYERGYISPTPYQYRQYRTINRVQVYSMNYDLDSETYDTGEIGLSDYLFGFFGVDLAAYYTLSYDEITNRTSTENPHTQLVSGGGYYNLDKTQRYGVDLNLRQDFSRVSLYENLSFVDATIQGNDLDGKRIPLVPRYKATLGADIEVIDDLRIFANATYASRMREDSENLYWIDDHFLVDVGARYEVGRFSFLLSAKNVFDKQYALSQSSSFDTATGIKSISVLPADGRSYYAKFSYKF